MLVYLYIIGIDSRVQKTILRYNNSLLLYLKYIGMFEYIIQFLS